MPVYTDGVHLVSNVLKHLHDFAESIGLKRHWFHNPRGKNHPHYDLPKRTDWLEKVLAAGAVKTTKQNCLEIAKDAAVREQMMREYAEDAPCADCPPREG